MNFWIKLYQLQVKEIMTVCCPWAWLCHQYFSRATLLGPILSFSTISSVTGGRELDALIRFSQIMTPSTSVVTRYLTTDGKHAQETPIQTIRRSTDQRNSLKLNSYRSLLPTLWLIVQPIISANLSVTKTGKPLKISDVDLYHQKQREKSKRKPGWWNKPLHTAERTGWLLRGPGGREVVCRRGSERPSGRIPLY